MIALAALAGFAGGFMFANSLNRSESQRFAANLQQPIAANADDATLSPEEIRARLEEADRDPQNLQLQKNLGTALYRYAAMRQDAELITQAIRLLDRAAQLDPKDVDVMVGLGNAHFDIGYFRKENEAFARARMHYSKALRARPTDTDLRTDMALSYFLESPPQLDNAATEFERALEADPKNGKAMNFYIQTLVKKGEKEKARETLGRLRELGPNDQLISELTSMIDGK